MKGIVVLTVGVCLVCLGAILFAVPSQPSALSDSRATPRTSIWLPVVLDVNAGAVGRTATAAARGGAAVGTRSNADAGLVGFRRSARPG